MTSGGTAWAPTPTSHTHSLAFCLRGAAEVDDDLYVMINAYWRALTFTVHDGGARTWKRVVDTSLTSPSDFREPGFEVPLQSRTYSVAPRSVVVLIRSNMAAEEAGTRVTVPFDQIRNTSGSARR
jgi:isoamylase